MHASPHPPSHRGQPPTPFPSDTAHPPLHLTPAETHFLNTLLPRGFALLACTLSPPLSTPSPPLFSSQPSPQLLPPKSKRVSTHNQLLLEEPWTAHSIRALDLTINTDFGASLGKRAKKQHSSDLSAAATLLRHNLTIIRKKLLRGDYFGTSHFLREVNLVWEQAKLRSATINADSLLQDSTAILEQVFLDYYHGRNSVLQQVRQAALSRAKVDTKRRKAPSRALRLRRKNSDNGCSKLTAETDLKMCLSPLDRTEAHAELVHRISHLREIDVRCVYELLSREGQVAGHGEELNKLEISLDSLSDSMVRELLTLVRSLHLPNLVSPPFDNSQAPKLNAIQKVQPARVTKGHSQRVPDCGDSSNSSFLSDSDSD